MLVLARKVGEKLKIGDSIEVVVVEIKGDTVRLGLTAPRGVAIYRQEIFDAIQRENMAASTIAPNLELQTLPTLHQRPTKT